MINLEIWSDIVCPFCYIGKRHFEAALSQFEHRDQVRVTWKSFELDAEAPRDPRGSVYEILAKKYGRTLNQARQMCEQVAERAAQVGLVFDFDRSITTNSFDAHRLAHLAAKHGIQDQAEEKLFSAYFCEGKNIGDPNFLLQLGVEIGLDRGEVEKLLASDAFATDVRRDEEEAQAIGISGVPFFLFNRKYAVSGAQPTELFLKALKTAWDDRGSTPDRIGDDGEACGDDGCEI